MRLELFGVGLFGVFLTSIVPSRGPQCLFGERDTGSDGDLFSTGAQDTTLRDWTL